MSERKLTLEEIDVLYNFCEDQGVRYFDLQIELVDHLAAAIEQEWKVKPKLTFYDALFSIFDKFGATGFQKIKSTKEKEMRKKYNRIQWKYIGEFFKLPKIILTILITLILFSILQDPILNVWIFRYVFWAYAISAIVFLIFFYPKKYRLILIPEKSFLLYSQLKMFRNVVLSFSPMPFYVLRWYREILYSSDFTSSSLLFINLTTAFILTIISIIMFVISVNVPSRIKEDFTREYPQFVKS